MSLTPGVQQAPFRHQKAMMQFGKCQVSPNQVAQKWLDQSLAIPLQNSSDDMGLPQRIPAHVHCNAPGEQHALS